MTTVKAMSAGAVLTALTGSLTACNTNTGAASGAAWKPTRSVTIDVPFAPGGGSDVFGRALQQGIQKVSPGVHVNVEDRPGGNGAVGYSYFFTKRSDPYFLLPSETVGVALPITTKTPWKWSDFTPIAQVAEDVNLLVVPSGSPYKDLKTTVAAAKQGKQIRMGLTGAISVDGVDTSLMERNQGVTFDRVSFDSGGEEVAGLLGHDIDMAMLNPSEVIGQLKAGKLRAIAVFADQRFKQAPLNTVPTAKEQGVNVSFTQYRGVFATGGITAAQQKYWEDTITKWTRSPSYTQFIQTAYLNPLQRGHDAFVSYLKSYQVSLESVLKKN